MTFRSLYRRFPILTALILLAGMTQIARADDTDLGEAADELLPGQGANRPNTHQHLWKRPDGTLYLKTLTGKTTFDVPAGTKVKTVGGMSFTAPTPGPGPARTFDMDLRVWIQDEVSGITAVAPSLGETFYALALPTSLDAEGNLADLFGDTPAVVTGAIGFEQGDSLLSILGSSTPDGLTPVVFDYDPSVTALALALNNDPSFEQFVAGTVYTPVPGTTGEVAGTVTPEPVTGVMLALGCAGIAYCRRRFGTL